MFNHKTSAADAAARPRAFDEERLRMLYRKTSIADVVVGL